MKPILLILALSAVAGGCVTTSSQYAYPRASGYIVTEMRGTPVVRWLGAGRTGDTVANARLGDTIYATAYYDEFKSGEWATWHLLVRGTDSVAVNAADVKAFAMLHPSTFTLPAARDKDAWARANYYVGKHATMKIQVATDYEVTTYNAVRPGDRSYSVQRLPQGDSVRYDVSCNGRSDSDFARMCAYYIATGLQP